MSTVSKSTVTPWTTSEKLAAEKELLGFYVSGHPLNPYRATLENGRFTPINALGELEDRTNFKAAGRLSDVQKKFTKKEGKPFAVIILEDLTGSIEAMVWNETFTKFTKLLEVGAVVSIAGRVDRRGEELRVAINEFAPLRLPRPSALPVRLAFALETTGPEELDAVREVLLDFPGETPVEFEFRRSADGALLRLHAGPDWRVRPTEQMRDRLRDWLQPETAVAA